MDKDKRWAIAFGTNTCICGVIMLIGTFNDVSYNSDNYIFGIILLIIGYISIIIYSIIFMQYNSSLRNKSESRA
ncbi:MAG: hypothetical protein KGD65_16955 [Candidatus Lokiarchaeota archaeon]|nr:hypothetical protein [Candidatus Lokiarchaeota archaeon]